MARRTINSPGVEIGEVDLSLRLPTPAGTTVYITGYTDQGPTDEVLSVSSLSEFEQIYGNPKTPAERYFFHTVRATLNSTANVLVNRLPYGTDTGEGFGSSISVLAYPVQSVTSSATFNVLSAYELSLNFDSSVRGAALSGAAFSVLLSDSRVVTVNFSVDSAAPARGVNALGLPAATATTFTIPIVTATQTTVALIKEKIVSQFNLSAIAAGTAVSINGSSLRVELSSWIPSTYTGAVSSSIVSGLEDVGDIFTLTNTSRLSSSSESVVSSNLDINSGTYLLGKPTQFNINQEQYTQLVNGTLFTEWSKTAITDFSSISALSGAGVIVVNKGQTVIDGKYQGYYVGLADNTNINPANDFDAIRTAYTVSQSAESAGLENYISIPTTRFDFALSATSGDGSNPAANSISQVMESKIVGYDTSTISFDDTLNVGVFKLRQSVFANDATTLSYVLEEGYNGSIGYFRQINSENGGQPLNFFLENVENNSRNVDILVNPYISDYFNGIKLDENGNPTKKIRLISNQLSATLASTTLSAAARAGCTLAQFEAAAATLKYADALFPLGAYGEVKINDKVIGDIPKKVTRALERIKNDEVFDIDIIAEAGLGTIWTTLGTTGLTYFDDTKTSQAIEALRTTSDLTDATARNYYNSIFSLFNVFCGPIKDGGRGDIMFIADPIRQILVTGKDTKVINIPGKNFSRDIYWALRHQFENANTSYSATYANYMLVYDNYSGMYSYVPPSGFVAAKMASTDAEQGPWVAPAGFNRGVINDALDLALSPNQRQRDELYKVSLNPITRFPSQGLVIFGQKTLLKKPSAFDRINVRRSFLYLEKATKSVMKFFLFENNTLFNRSRVVNTLTPFFERVKVADGLYEYLIVCDGRNNTTEVIDNNELVVDIYLKPVKSAEFILVNFYATRSDTSFRELAGG